MLLGMVLTEAKIDAVEIANNHMLDWKVQGLVETLETLKTLKIQFAGMSAK